MTHRKVSHNGKDFGVVVEQLRKKRYITRIDFDNSIGHYLREPDFEMKDPESGETTTKQGQLVEFDSEKEAFAAGEDRIKSLT